MVCYLLLCKKGYGERNQGQSRAANWKVSERPLLPPVRAWTLPPLLTSAEGGGGDHVPRLEAFS